MEHVDPEDWINTHGYLPKWAPKVWTAFCDEYWDSDTRCAYGVASNAEAIARTVDRAKAWKAAGIPCDAKQLYDDMFHAMTKHRGFSGKQLWKHRHELHACVKDLVEELSEPGTALCVLCCRLCT